MTDNLPTEDSRTSPHLAFAHAGALLAVAVVTVLGLAMAARWGSGPIVLLYIPAVLAAAVFGGLWPALLAAVAATLAYNYYFTAPVRTFRIDQSADVVTVAVLFVVAVVTSQLAGRLRDQARLAAAYAARNATIAGFARRLLSCSGEEDIARVAADQVSSLFACHAVVVAADQPTRVLASTPTATMLAPSDLAAAAIVFETGEPAGRGLRKLDLADWQFHPVASESRVIAAVGLARPDGQPPVAGYHLALLGNLLDQLALALVRAQLEREAREFAALHQRDQLRSVLLASIGEDIKPRINAIADAARSLRREGSSDRATVAGLTSEAAKLDRYIENLIDLSPGTEQAPIEIGPLVIDLHRRRVAKDGVAIALTPKEYAVLAELARNAGRVLSHAHLLRAVWGPAHEDQIEYLRVAIRALRTKLEQEPAKPTLILNQPAIGYQLARP